MKKIILVLGIIALLTGCGEEEQMMTCTMNNTTNGLTSGTEYLVTYKDDEVSHVRITYNYNQDTHTDGVGTGTDGTTEDGNENQNDNNKPDGVIENNPNDNDGIVDGVVGDVLIGGIYNTILDISGLKNRHTNDMNYSNITGFTSNVENNTNNSYKVVYDLDLTKISDDDIGKFNVDRSYTTLKDNYTNQGLTCK